MHTHTCIHYYKNSQNEFMISENVLMCQNWSDFFVITMPSLYSICSESFKKNLKQEEKSNHVVMQLPLWAKENTITTIYFHAFFFFY